MLNVAILYTIRALPDRSLFVESLRVVDSEIMVGGSVHVCHMVIGSFK